MKSLKIAKWSLGLLALLMVCLAAGPLFATDQVISRTDYKKLAQEAYANADGTKKICLSVVKQLKAKMAASKPSDLLKNEVEDALHWFGKADAILVKGKKQMDENKYTKDLVLELNQSWHYFIKAGSAGVRATMMD